MRKKQKHENWKKLFEELRSNLVLREHEKANLQEQVACLKKMIGKASFVVEVNDDRLLTKLKCFILNLLCYPIVRFQITHYIYGGDKAGNDLIITASNRQYASMFTGHYWNGEVAKTKKKARRKKRR